MAQERHNKAARLILKAVGQGSHGGSLLFADVGLTKDDPAPDEAEDDSCINVRSSRKQMAQWLLNTGCDGLPSYPDAVLCLSAGQHFGAAELIPPSERKLLLVEVKYCAETREALKRQEDRAQTQHEELIAMLKDKCKSAEVVPILLGVGSVVFTEHTKNRLKKLGVKGQPLESLLTALSRHAAHAAHSMVVLRRSLQPAQHATGRTTGPPTRGQRRYPPKGCRGQS